MKKLIATAVMGLTIAFTPLSASAQYTSYYDAAWFQRMDQMRQINFAKLIVRNYTRINERYAFIINKYSASDSHGTSGSSRDIRGNNQKLQSTILLLVLIMHLKLYELM